MATDCGIDGGYESKSKVRFEVALTQNKLSSDFPERQDPGRISSGSALLSLVVSS
jgi:hypothetical protein